MLVSLLLIKSVSTGAEICCRFCQALPSDPYRLGCGIVSLTVSYKRTNNVESTLIQPHDIETMLIQHCCVPSRKPFQNIGVGRFRKLGKNRGSFIISQVTGVKSWLGVPPSDTSILYWGNGKMTMLSHAQCYLFMMENIYISRN